MTSPFPCDKTLEGWENGSVVILHWSLTFDLSFIFYYQGGCQQPFSGGHNYFCVDYCVTRRGSQFSTLPSGDGVWVRGGSNWPRVSRGILNSICQFLPPQCRTAAPGAATFSVALPSEGDGTGSGASTFIKCKCKRLWWVHRAGIFCQAKNAHCVWQRCSERIWPLTRLRSGGETQWQQWRASPPLNPQELLIVHVYIHSKSLSLFFNRFFPVTDSDVTY